MCLKSPLVFVDTHILIGEQAGFPEPPHGTDGAPPFLSQMLSELSTPPQSPKHLKAKESGISFVSLAKEDSEMNESVDEQPPLKRSLEVTPAIEATTSKKRSVRAFLVRKSQNNLS